MNKRIIISFILIILLRIFLFSENKKEKLEIIHSDTVEVIFKEGKEEKINFIGNNELRYLNQLLKSEYLVYNKNENTIHSEEEVYITSEEYQMKAERFKINLITEDLYLTNSSGEYLPWYYKAEKVEVKKREEYILEKGYFTSCNEVNPHFRFVFKKIRFIKNDKLLGYNMFFYIGKIPIFYLPYFRKNLKYSPWSYTIGYSNTRGLFMKNRYDIYHKDKINFQVLLDLYTKAGIGTGLKYEQNDDTTLSNILGYHINEKINKEKNERYKIEGNYSRKINQQIIFTSLFNYYSDANINQSYSSDYNYLTRYSDIKATLVKYSEKDLMQFYYTRHSERDITRNKYKLKEENKPAFYYFRNYQAIKNFIYNYSFDYRNEYDYLKDKYNSKINLANNFMFKQIINKNFNLLFILSNNVYYNSESETDSFKRITDKISSGINFKYYLNLNNFIITQYNFQKRMNNINKFPYDYKGIENNNIKVSYNYLTNNSFIRIGTGYDFREYENETTKNENKKMNIEGKVEYSNKNIKLYEEINYSVEEKCVNKNYLGFEYNEKDLFSYSGIINYYDNTYKKLNIINKFNIAIGKYFTPKKDKDYILSYYDRIDLKARKLKENYISLEKRLHCFTLKLQYKKYLTDEREYYLIFYINDIEAKNVSVLYNSKDKGIKLKSDF
ncbi:MAG TPA: hypothetical protein PLD27_10595 [bacterium]|nr:hypothetical protein [bacterium]HOL47886.1 hypothetical protein [bacterium]HPQ19676.1 hypothetical protein [bacterium]